MFETLDPPEPEPWKDWVAPTVYGGYFVLTALVVVIRFWRHWTIGRLDLVCYAAVFVLGLYFFIETRIHRPTQKGASNRCFILFLLTYLPTFVHSTFM